MIKLIEVFTSVNNLVQKDHYLDLLIKEQLKIESVIEEKIINFLYCLI